MLIVGGGPAGAAAAVYAARKGIRTGVVAERFGGQVLDTMSIENYISVLETDGPKFAAALEAHTRHYGVDIMNLQKVESISRDEAAGMVTVKTASGASLKSKTVILATGARWRSMGVPGEQEYRNRGVTYCPHCDGPLFKGKRVAVIGGGNSGVEAAIDLAGVVDHVTLFEFMPELRADAVLQRKLESLPNVKILKNVQVTEVKASNDHRLQGPHQRQHPRSGAGRRVRPDRPGAQHRLPEGQWHHAGPQRRDPGRRSWPDLDGRRVCRR